MTQRNAGTIYNIHIYIYSSYDETIQRKQSAQYRKRRAIIVSEVSVTLTIYIYIYIYICIPLD